MPTPSVPSLPSDGQSDPLKWFPSRPLPASEFCAETGYVEPDAYRAKAASDSLPYSNRED